MNKPRAKSKTRTPSATRLILTRAQQTPGALLRPSDIAGATPTAAAKALARLAAKGVLTREAKGLYYAPRATLLGPSRPSELAVLQAAMARRARPTGVTAANLLGVSTQVPARAEYALYASAKPRGSAAAKVRLRKSTAGNRAQPEGLCTLHVALLEFLRDRGVTGELDPDATLERLRQLLRNENGEESAGTTMPTALRSLVSAALDEPPRVRAMLGALLQWAGASHSLYSPLRSSLNPLTRFHFGLFRALPNAREWQAR